ncbi:cytochrome P450 [Streptomyces sp. NPDC056773]|uniref:cytochrome P450 n=1 Tax=unclassified Streptomyces TaxID=2593676 RepID=UPI003676B548
MRTSRRVRRSTGGRGPRSTRTRLDPPLQVVRRRATADLAVGGVRVPKGTVMVLLLAAAHRDPAPGPGPDLFATGTPSCRPTAALRGLRALWVAADGFAARDLPRVRVIEERTS